MKEQDLIRALSALPQDLLDELDEWQKSGAPLTGTEQETDTPARTGKPVITQRRKQKMKHQSEKMPVRLRAWTAGIAAAVVICSAIAIPVGREAVRRAGYTDSIVQSAAEPAVNTVQHDPVPLGNGGYYYAGSDKTDIAVPEEGAVQVLRCMEDMQPFLSLIERKEYLSSMQYQTHKQLNEETFEASDVLYFAMKDNQIPHNSYSYHFTGGSIEGDGSLTLHFSALILDDRPENYDMYSVRAENLYYFYEVPKNSLPDISKVSVTFTESCIGELPEDVKSDWNQIIPQEPSEQRIINVLTDYLQNTQKYQDWMNSIPEQLYITWNAVQPENSTLTIENPDKEDHTPENAFYAWYWDGYCGDDIPLEGKTAAVIRTAADGKPYLTGSGQQDQTNLATILSEAWLETGAPADEAYTDPVSGAVTGHDGEPHDVIFIGIPANALPKNTVRADYHNGTVTPSGKLHLDLSLLTVTDETAAVLPAERF